MPIIQTLPVLFAMKYVTPVFLLLFVFGLIFKLTRS